MGRFFVTISTKLHKSTQMTQQQLLAFRLRLEGFTYQQISKHTKWSEFTLRKYFSPKGKWHNDYQAWKNQTLSETQDEIENMIKRESLSAARVLIKIMQNAKKPNLALKAADSILDRAGFSRNRPLAQPGSEDVAERMFRWMENRKRNENEKNKNQYT